MRTLIVCLNDETVDAIRDYEKVKSMPTDKAVNDLIMQGYYSACEEGDNDEFCIL